MRLGEALTRGAFLSITPGLVPPSMGGSQEQDASTPLPLLIIALYDNSGFTSTTPDPSQPVQRPTMSRKTADSPVPPSASGRTSAMARWDASSPAPSTSTSGAGGLPRHRRRAFERQQRHLDLAALLSVQLNPTDSRCKNNWRPMCCKYDFSRQDIVLYPRQRRTPV